MQKYGPAYVWNKNRSGASNIASLVQSELCLTANPYLQTNTEEKICGKMTYELSVIDQLIIIMHYSTLPRLLHVISWWRRLICVFYNRIKRSMINPALSVKSGPLRWSNIISLCWLRFNELKGKLSVILLTQKKRMIIMT